MRITVTRIDTRRYATVVERDDGVVLSVPGYGFMRALPHDLAHWVVESMLRLDHGFWGSIASGARLRGMQLLQGRQKPHAAERSKEVEKTNASFLNEAERLVACFETLAAQHAGAATGRSEKAKVMLRRREKNLTSAEIAKVCTAWSALQQRWDALAVGDMMRLDWPAPRAGRR